MTFSQYLSPDLRPFPSLFRIIVGFLAILSTIGTIARSDPAQAASSGWQLEFDNQCPASIVIGVNGGAVITPNPAHKKDKNAPPNINLACGVVDPKNPLSCPKGSGCNKSNNTCYWGTLDVGGTAVVGSGKAITKTYTFPEYNGVRWAGNVYASAQCDSKGEKCQTGVCAISKDGKTIIGPCPFGAGPNGPTTLAEFTLLETGVDTYDISIINGFNVPVSMGPLIASPGSSSSNPYTCGVAGGVAQPSGSKLQSCSWSFDATFARPGGTSPVDNTAQLAAVTQGGQPCSSSNDTCPSGQVCGRAFVPGTINVPQSCGTQIGWWTADQLCVATANGMGAPFNCSSKSALYGCTGPTYGNSCYKAGAQKDDCCGCPNWKINGVKLPLTPGTACQAHDKTWADDSKPWLDFLKAACPTAYTFPFDDGTSTFTCPSSNSGASTGYKITFCPGGTTGF